MFTCQSGRVIGIFPGFLSNRHCVALAPPLHSQAFPGGSWHPLAGLGRDLGEGERRKDAPGRPSCPVPGWRAQPQGLLRSPGCLPLQQKRELGCVQVQGNACHSPGQGLAFHPSLLHRPPPSPGVLPSLPPWLSLPCSPFVSVRSDASC